MKVQAIVDIEIYDKDADYCDVMCPYMMDSAIHCQLSGKKVRLHWVFMSASQDNNVEVLAKIKLGSTVVYSTFLGNPGAFGHRETVEGAVDEPLKINLSAAESVAVNWTVTEE